MRPLTHISRVAFIGCIVCCCFQLLAQPYTSIEVSKPEKYRNRLLPAEKSGNKKFTIPKRLYNNTVSEYNYYFNANNKLNDIVALAKQNFKDDYTQLLPFYNYSLAETAKGQIDSVLYKCTAGILLHDLRSDWVDRFYLLMGNAYLHRQDFDSAYQVFQYINYSFAPKDDGYDIPIGSNISSRNGSFSIATNEKGNIWKKISSNLPARNESFLFQVRNLIEQKRFPEAESLLEIIRADNQFPSRLKNKWYEMEAYLNYTEQHYDSAAYFIIKALPTTENKAEAARWEYLAAQMMAIAGKDSTSISLFEKAIKHTTDPLMDVNARLNIASLSAENKPNAVQQNLKELLIMAKRDRYQNYRDIIYYAASELEIKQKRLPAAEQLLYKSIEAIDNNELQKAKSYLLLADIAYLQKKYIPAANYYDSVSIGILDTALQKTAAFKKLTLKNIAANFTSINKEDSLQAIANLQEFERMALLKNLLKKLRKEKGLKEPNAEINFGSNFIEVPTNDIFQTANTDFYFASSNLKTKGVSDFKLKWGNRPNIDHWRRQSAVDRSFSNKVIEPSDALAQIDQQSEAEKEISIEALMIDLPLSPDKVLKSNEKILQALLKNGAIFQYQLEDIDAAITMYEAIAKRFQEHPILEELWLELSNCYRKKGDFIKADSVKKQLTSFYPSGKFNANLQENANTVNAKAIKIYTHIYNIFLEGKFEAANEEKIRADKLYGKTFWTPQLLFIEAIYDIRQRKDSTAINKLSQIISLFGNSEIAEKANNMILVLNKRTEIESYLTQLDVERSEDIPTRKIDLNTTTTAPIPVKNTTNIQVKIPENLPATAPTIENKKTGINPALDTYQFNANDTQYVVVILDKVDPVFITEGKNAFNRFNQERYYSQKIPLNVLPITESLQLLLMGPFLNAADATTYIDKTKPLAESRIIPWLAKEKYRFIILSTSNLLLLKQKKEIATYLKFLSTLFPDKF